MDALILLGSFFALVFLGVPIAYSLGLSALVGALWVDLPLDAVMILSLIHISEPTRPERISYAVFCLKKKTNWRT